MDDVAHLTSAIAVHLREWEQSPPFAELAIIETSDPQQRFAQILDAFREEVLGARVVRRLFHQSSIGSVTGVALAAARTSGDQGASAAALMRVSHKDRKSSKII